MLKTNGESVTFRARPFENQQHQISEVHNNLAVVPLGFEDAKFDILIETTNGSLQKSSSSLLCKFLMQSTG